jgi:aminoglycoside phosphotransferase
VRPLRHGYTNTVLGDGTVVTKRYEGPDAPDRLRRELTTLIYLRGLLPVPAVLPDTPDGEVKMSFMAGKPGQELIESGHANEVLRASGDLLRRVQAIDVARVFPETAFPEPRDGSGSVVVHGDFGPNNVLIDPATHAVTAVLDWEWAHPGEPVEDLAWCEWIIRMHHPDQIAALDALFAAYGQRPTWPERHDAMQERCRQLLHLCRRWHEDAVQLWQRRLHVTTTWRESPSQLP